MNVRRSDATKSYTFSVVTFPPPVSSYPQCRNLTEGTTKMTIVVTGATGNVGRPLVTELVAAGARVRAVTRTPKTAGFPADVELVDSAADALTGASAVFLNSPALGEQLPNVVAQCRTAGVAKLVARAAINAHD